MPSDEALGVLTKANIEKRRKTLQGNGVALLAASGTFVGLLDVVAWQFPELSKAELQAGMHRFLHNSVC